MYFATSQEQKITLLMRQDNETLQRALDDVEVTLKRLRLHHCLLLALHIHIHVLTGNPLQKSIKHLRFPVGYLSGVLK